MNQVICQKQSNTEADVDSGVSQGTTKRRRSGDHGKGIGLPVSIIRSIEQRKYETACDKLRACPRSPLVTETLSVCLLRSGRIDESLNLLRSLALTPGSTTLRPESTDSVRVNLATALLLKRLPSGALDTLNEMRDRNTPAAAQLRNAITNWATGLSWFRRWDWKLNRIDPPDAVVPINFEPGELPSFYSEIARSTA